MRSKWHSALQQPELKSGMNDDQDRRAPAASTDMFPANVRSSGTRPCVAAASFGV
ncbi:hypothetical protein [Glycomyces rhizosphaerae]|uniref:Uncharacterized protein n=1 Tax=Glycomyces rhizosphaerae TaxID=2054422 RepID=A0ABV7PTQ3_9ACTN